MSEIIPPLSSMFELIIILYDESFPFLMPKTDPSLSFIIGRFLFLYSSYKKSCTSFSSPETPLNWHNSSNLIPSPFLLFI